MGSWGSGVTAGRSVAFCVGGAVVCEASFFDTVTYKAAAPMTAMIVPMITQDFFIIVSVYHLVCIAHLLHLWYIREDVKTQNIHSATVQIVPNNEAAFAPAQTLDQKVVQK